VESFADLGHEPMSLDGPVGGSTDLLLGEVIASDDLDPAEAAIATDRAKQLARLLAHLPQRERTILSQRYGLDGRGTRTLREIGDAAGVSRERIRQLESDAISRLKVLARLTGANDAEPLERELA
jgi:RNA polymerase primary sigma factor